MDVAVTDISGCKKSLNIVIPAEVAQGEFDRRTRELARKVRLPGFRPGKAPASLIKQRFQDEIKKEVLHDLVEARLDSLIKAKGLTPLSRPVVERLEFELGSPVKLDISFEVWPEVRLPEYQDLAIPVKKSPEITEEEVDKVLEQTREDAATYVPIEDRPIQTGDLVKIHMEAMHSVNQQWAPLDRTETTFTVGDSQVYPVFSENLTGMKTGEEKEFTFEYPPQFGDRRLAGKTIRHKVGVLDVKAKVLPEINDDLARDADHETLDQLKDSIRARLREQARRAREEEIKERLVEQLLDAAPFEVPDVLVQDRLQHILVGLAQYLNRQGIDVKTARLNWEKIAEENRPRARREVQRGIFLDLIAKREHLEVLPAEVDMELARIANASGVSAEVARASYQQQDRMEELKTELRFKKALDFIYRHAKLINDQGSELC